MSFKWVICAHLSMTSMRRKRPTDERTTDYSNSLLFVFRPSVWWVETKIRYKFMLKSHFMLCESGYKGIGQVLGFFLSFKTNFLVFGKMLAKIGYILYFSTQLIFMNNFKLFFEVKKSKFKSYFSKFNCYNYYHKLRKRNSS